MWERQTFEHVKNTNHKEKLHNRNHKEKLHNSNHPDIIRANENYKRERVSIMKETKNKLYWPDYNKYDDLFVSLLSKNKKILQKIIWLDNKNQDSKFWPKTYTKLMTFISKNYKWQNIENFNDIIKEHRNDVTIENDISDKKNNKDSKNKSYKNIDNSNFETITVKATAYYWPLKWQSHYATWSYAWDVRLQWSWIKTASWKKPKPWMIATPSNIAFWTKILLPDSVAQMAWAKSSLVTVQDRGGAIKWNRVDIFFWYWEEALHRANLFWKKNIKIQIAKNGVNDLPTMA
jgi:3D (Asp-Asp-Asp) domain-containing protein